MSETSNPAGQLTGDLAEEGVLAAVIGKVEAALDKAANGYGCALFLRCHYTGGWQHVGAGHDEGKGLETAFADVRPELKPSERFLARGDRAGHVPIGERDGELTGCISVVAPQGHKLHVSVVLPLREIADAAGTALHRVRDEAEADLRVRWTESFSTLPSKLRAAGGDEQILDALRETIALALREAD